MTDYTRWRATLWWLGVGIPSVMLAATLASPAQQVTFTTLHTFAGADGESPSAALVQATDGNLYGTTLEGGANGNFGTVFRIAMDGTLTTLHSFDGKDGANPRGLLEANNGYLYGTTDSGGANSAGTVFRMSLGGTFTTLYNFCGQAGCSDGAQPAVLIQSTDGDFYGGTLAGGTSGTCQSADCGTLFGLTPTGTLTTLYTFCSQTGCPDGDNPTDLIEANDKSAFGYGTTQYGGSGNSGTVFKISRSHGTLETLHSFDGTDGLLPNGVIQTTNGNLYGTTENGGANSQQVGGTVFKITTSGVLSTLYSFCARSNCTDGSNPYAPLVQASDGNFYGTTGGGGADGSCLPAGCGTLFKITASGLLETLYSFCHQSGCSDGSQPLAALLQDTNGSFYGATPNGGANNAGTIFSLSVGLGQFVKAASTMGTVGEHIEILGTSLLGATSVSFNGAPAAFTVVSAYYISATVPAGATTGFVTVTTPSGTLKSNVAFIVKAS